jgi:hypothetical protein
MTACPNFEDHCSSEVHDFIMPVKIIVPRDTLLVGDTIWFESSFSSTVRDTLLKKDIYFPNGVMALTLLPIEYLPPKDGQIVSNLGSAYNLFEKVSKVENSISTYAKVYYYYNKDTEQYNVKVGYIAKKRGEYFIAFGGSAADQEGVECDDFDVAYTNFEYLSSNHNLFDALNKKYQNKVEYPITEHHFGFVVK